MRSCGELKFRQSAKNARNLYVIEFIVLILAVAGLFLTFSLFRNAIQKSRTVKILEAFLGSSMATKNDQLDRTKKLAREIASAVRPQRETQLIGGGTAKNSPVGEAIFALTMAAERGRGGPDEVTLFSALGGLVASCARGNFDRLMTALDDENLRYASGVYIEWAKLH